MEITHDYKMEVDRAETVNIMVGTFIMSIHSLVRRTSNEI